MFKLYASCDPVYLRDHAPALMASAAKANNNLHIHIINGGGEEVRFMDGLRQKWEKMTDAALSYTWDKQFAIGMTPAENRTIFACDRFVSASVLIDNHKEDFLIIDTDCLVMNHIEPIVDDQIGLFLREPLPGTQGWENAGSRVAAGAVFVSKECGPFLDKVAARIKKGPLAWFLDQVAINEVYQEHMGDYRFKYFGSTFLDWEFLPNTTIWTGKGPRKYDNPTYVAKKQYFDRMMR